MTEELKQIKDAYLLLESSIREWFSKLLANHDEDTKLYCRYPIFTNQEYFGMSELEKSYVDEMWQTNEGKIFIHIEGTGEDECCEISEFIIEDLLDFMENIEFIINN